MPIPFLGGSHASMAGAEKGAASVGYGPESIRQTSVCPVPSMRRNPGRPISNGPVQMWPLQIQKWPAAVASRLANAGEEAGSLKSRGNSWAAKERGGLRANVALAARGFGVQVHYLHCRNRPKCAATAPSSLDAPDF